MVFINVHQVKDFYQFALVTVILSLQRPDDAPDVAFYASVIFLHTAPQ